MKVFEKLNAADAAVAVNDVQIQTPAAKLAFSIKTTYSSTSPNVDFSKIEVRLKHVSVKGTVVLIERTSLTTLMEICASNEGFYIDNNNILMGTVDISPNGKALDLAGGYLSLDVDTKTLAVASVVVNTIDSPELTNVFTYYNPVYVNGGITKDVELAGVNLIAVDHATIDNIQLNFPARSITYTQDELAHIARDLNDLVFFGGVNGNTYGYQNYIVLPVAAVRRMTVTPKDVAGFYMYLLEEKAI